MDAIAADGVITRWRVRGGSAGGTFALRVIRQTGASDFVAVGTSAPGDVVAGTENSFATRLPIRSGESIGLDIPGAANTPAVSTVTGQPAGTGFAAYVPRLVDNAAAVPPLGVVAGELALVNADVEADADKDGFGDETQDLCPTDATKQGDCAAPSADLTKTPKRKSHSRTATFKFGSDESAVTFQCRIDQKAFKPCTSPKKFRKLKVRKHKFRLLATDGAGNVSEETTFRWRVVD
jgi:hypothetical protein